MKQRRITCEITEFVTDDGDARPPIIPTLVEY
jgi:hypothetical protein